VRRARYRRGAWTFNRGILRVSGASRPAARSSGNDRGTLKTEDITGSSMRGGRAAWRISTGMTFEGWSCSSGPRGSCIWAAPDPTSGQRRVDWQAKQTIDLELLKEDGRLARGAGRSRRDLSQRGQAETGRRAGLACEGHVKNSCGGLVGFWRMERDTPCARDRRRPLAAVLLVCLVGQRRHGRGRARRPAKPQDAFVQVEPASRPLSASPPRKNRGRPRAQAVSILRGPFASFRGRVLGAVLRGAAQRERHSLVRP
jgi:hypothetical protein